MKVERYKPILKLKESIEDNKLDSVSYSEALKMIKTRAYWRFSNYFPTLSFGGGRFEKWWSDIGNKINISDINNLKDDDIVSLMTNIFYNGINLSNTMSHIVIKHLIDIYFDKKIYNIYGDPEQERTQYMAYHKGYFKTEHSYLMQKFNNLGI
jgi:hypothetical protein